MDAVEFGGEALHHVLRQRLAGGRATAAAVQAGKLLAQLANAGHLFHRHLEILVQAGVFEGLEGLFKIDGVAQIVQFLVGYLLLRAGLGQHLRKQADAVAGDEHVFKRQRAAHAAAQTGQPFKVAHFGQAVVFDLFQHADDIVDAVHGQRLVFADGQRFAARARPVDAEGSGGKVGQIGLQIALAQKFGEHAVDLQEGDRAIDRAGLVAQRVADGGHLRRAGGDEEAAHVLVGHAALGAEAAARLDGGHFHGAFDVDDVVDQFGKARLDQPHHRRAA